ncbi:MAG: hypothetical protein LBQ60_02625 [Bacteroidales bacterium]|nr:hypothetical protein [Bacteroidales bacterium]
MVRVLALMVRVLVVQVVLALVVRVLGVLEVQILVLLLIHIYLVKPAVRLIKQQQAMTKMESISGLQ